MLQERMARPSRCTVQHPHRPAPQPKRVPRRSSSSRNTHRSGVSGALSTWRRAPLTLISIMIALPMGLSCRHVFARPSSAAPAAGWRLAPPCNRQLDAKTWDHWSATTNTPGFPPMTTIDNPPRRAILQPALGSAHFGGQKANFSARVARLSGRLIEKASEHSPRIANSGFGRTRYRLSCNRSRRLWSVGPPHTQAFQPLQHTHTSRTPQ
jgi:hypothetical protein